MCESLGAALENNALSASCFDHLMRVLSHYAVHFRHPPCGNVRAFRVTAVLKHVINEVRMRSAGVSKFGSDNAGAVLLNFQAA